MWRSRTYPDRKQNGFSHGRVSLQFPRSPLFGQRKIQQRWKMQADATQADIDSLQSPSVFRGLHSQALLLPSQADTFGGSQTDDEGGGSVPFFKGRPPPTLTNSTGGSSTRPPNPRINTLWTDGHSAGLSTSSGTPSALPSQTPSVSTPRPPTSANSTLWSTSYTRADVSNPKAPPSNFNFVGDSSRTPNSASTTISWSRNTPHARSKEGLQTQQTNPLPPLHKHLPSRAPTFVPPSQYSANQSSASQNVFSEPTPLNIPPSDSPSPMPYPTEPKLFIMRKELELLMADVLKQLKVAHDFLAQSREHLQSNVEHEISSKNNEYEGVKELFDQMGRDLACTPLTAESNECIGQIGQF
ncbi:hypothetical protein DFS34DRAFT_624176 [Phlyctochytrium arcticum]|nr:hypothetical protein DFS34DRAFT_624176 [Phlyctochytrium arcticum]